MRAILAATAIGLTSIGYLLGPAAALPRDCWDQLYECDAVLSRSGYSRSTIQSVCGSRMASCMRDNKRDGYNGWDAVGPPLGSKEEGDKKKPKDDWKRHVLPHVGSPVKSGSIGSNSQFGINTSTPPTTAAATATSSASNPMTELKPPKPGALSTGRAVGATRF